MEEFVLILEKLKEIKLFLHQVDLLFIFCLIAALMFKFCAWNKCYKEKRKIKKLMPEEKFLLKEIYFNRTSGLSINKGNEFIKTLEKKGMVYRSAHGILEDIQENTHIYNIRDWVRRTLEENPKLI